MKGYSFSLANYLAYAGLIICLSTIAACGRFNSTIGSDPRLEVTPLGQSGGRWMIVTSDVATFTVTARGAQQVRIMYRPLDSAAGLIEMAMLNQPVDGVKFVTEIKGASNFAGEVWAEILYPDHSTTRTKSLTLTFKKAVGARIGDVPLDSIGGSIGSNESERSDRVTGGKIEQAAFADGEHRIWITVNIPAFQLTFWQNGYEIKTYSIGIGRQDFPLPVGPRQATHIVWNPEWVPPDSSWVQESEEILPGEWVGSDDPRNPLGKIKIMLGQGILIHEAAKSSDIGGLVSHGCVRMRTEDLYDLTEKIIAAQSLPIDPQLIERVKASTERLAVKMTPPLYVDINYDTIVIENGILHLFPDVYNRVSNPLENLRAELDASGAGEIILDELMLGQALNRVSLSNAFMVRVADIRMGRAIMTGTNYPLTDRSLKKVVR
jgi:lipoprotein-anchoring transpeptidase ErfK/SrfK